MRILHVLDHSAPLHSGYAFRTLAILRRQRDLGWETIQITSPKQGPTGSLAEDAEGFRFHRTPGTASGFWANRPIARELSLIRALTRRLEPLARETRPDLLHAHSPILNALPALDVGRRLGIPVVYEVRAFWEDAAADHGTSRPGGWRYRATRMLETRVMRRADAVTAICEGLRGDIVRRGISASKVTVIPNAVDLANFAPGGAADPELARSLGLEGRRVLGFAGSFYAYEGLGLLLEAMPAILAEAPDVRLLLVGGGPEDDRLRERTKSLGLAERVVFTGRVPHEMVGKYYDLMDVMVYPRLSMRLTELVTPLKPLEAMAQGRLIVASDVGGHRELIRAGETGVLFSPGDAGALAKAVLSLLASSTTWAAMRAAARRFVESERTWERSVARYEAVYRSILRSSAR